MISAFFGLAVFITIVGLAVAGWSLARFLPVSLKNKIKQFLGE